MKNKLSLKLLTRWIALPLLVGSLFAWVVSPAYPSDVVSRAAQPQMPQVAIKDTAVNASDVQDIKDRIKELESKERQNYTLLLDDQRKKIDWWFSFLAVLTAVMAIAGGLIPFLMARKDKEIIEQDKTVIAQDKKEIEQDKEQTRTLLDEVKNIKNKAAEHLEETQQSSAEAAKILEKVQSGTSSAWGEKVEEAVAQVKKDKIANPLLKLRAEAIDASNEKNANKAYRLWAALTELAADDANAQFNAGYWAQNIATSNTLESSYWLKLAGTHYAEAQRINPEMHEAANNWGNALAAEAQALVASEPMAARNLWQRAGEMYQQALRINPKMHEAASNWGNSLAAEARALVASDPVAARSLWQHAREKYQQALRINPKMHDAAYNWGSALDDEAQALVESDPKAARRLWQQAGEKYQLALTIKPDKHEAANNWGIALAAEAQALVASDLVAARSLWQQAGEKYQLALTIKPDKHDAAYNWGVALLYEAGTIAISDPEQSSELLSQAERMLLAHADAAPSVVSYNLACIYGRRGDVQKCLHWLALCASEKKLPDCNHLISDKDLDSVRNTPEFIAWFAAVCGATDSPRTVKEDQT